MGDRFSMTEQVQTVMFNFLSTVKFIDKYLKAYLEFCICIQVTLKQHHLESYAEDPKEVRYYHLVYVQNLLTLPISTQEKKQTPSFKSGKSASHSILDFTFPYYLFLWYA